MYAWGVGVDGDFYQVLSPGWMGTEMVVAGPQGTSAFGNFIAMQGAKEKWLQDFKADIEAGRKPRCMWDAETETPRARPEEEWQDLEPCGWTAKTDEEIAAWIEKWVKQHPVYRAVDPFGSECNGQTFANAFISWLTSSTFERTTDSKKGRAIVYGGLALLAGAGIAYLFSQRNAVTLAPGARQRAETVETGRSRDTKEKSARTRFHTVDTRDTMEMETRPTTPFMDSRPTGTTLTSRLRGSSRSRTKTGMSRISVFSGAFD